MIELKAGEQENALHEIEVLDQQLYQTYASQFSFETFLSRSLVSFQANKTKPIYRWYKFKEAFSASLVEYFLDRFRIDEGVLLDPFAGSGTTLFAASARGVHADGVELLPIGQQIIGTKRLVKKELTADDRMILRQWVIHRPWQKWTAPIPLQELRITKGAYPPHTQNAIEQYLGAYQSENPRVQAVLRLALLCVLEAVSYTRKDGQYLRWDFRSGRRQGQKPFDKGIIPPFDEALSAKLEEIIDDLTHAKGQLDLFPSRVPGEIQLFAGSCLQILPSLPGQKYDAIITSPPYCNRYDYTRTYALELALLGITEHELVHLRQEMLSATVENRAKDLLTMNPQWQAAVTAADRQDLLQTILKYLDDQKVLGTLNNTGIPRMVRGYFYEMACVIAECARVLKPGAPLVMVNDNVRYAGASLSVDLILSDLAQRLGFAVESIWVLPDGKGNSSQQMGTYGRAPLRKCIYVWRRKDSDG